MNHLPAPTHPNYQYAYDGSRCPFCDCSAKKATITVEL